MSLSRIRDKRKVKVKEKIGGAGRKSTRPAVYMAYNIEFD